MIGRLARIAGAFFRSALQEEFAYRGDLLGNVIRSVLNLGTAVGSVAVIFTHTETLGGWTLGQAMSLLGIFVFVNGFVAMFMSPSLNRVVEEVREGTFDYVLMKPVPACSWPAHDGLPSGTYRTSCSAPSSSPWRSLASTPTSRAGACCCSWAC